MANKLLPSIDTLDVDNSNLNDSEHLIYPTEYLIATLQTLQKELGRAPTVNDVRNLSEVLPDTSTYERRFGSWIGALEAAGIEGSHNRSDETILRQLARLILELGRAPTKREIDKSPHVASSGTYRNRFGSLTAATTLAEDLIRELSR